MPGKGKAGEEQLDLFAEQDGEDADDRSLEELLNAYTRELAQQLEEAGVPVRHWYVEPVAPGEFKACVVPLEAAKFLSWTERFGWTACVSLGKGKYTRSDYMHAAVAPPVTEVVAWFGWSLEHGGHEKPGRRKGSGQYGLRERLLMVAPSARASRCGTGLGYQSHIDEGEEPCSRCAAAFAELDSAGVVQPRPTK